jgi:hypothetical protein
MTPTLAAVDRDPVGRFAAEWTSARTVCRVFLGLGETAEAAWEVARRQLRHAGPLDWNAGCVRVFEVARARRASAGRRAAVWIGGAS